MRHDVNMTASGQAEHARLPLLGRMLALLIRDGELTVVDSRGRRSVFGNPGGRPGVTVQLHNAGLPLRLALYPYLAFGHAFVDVGGNDRVRNDADAGKQVEAARARGREYQPHQG